MRRFEIGVSLEKVFESFGLEEPAELIAFSSSGPTALPFVKKSYRTLLVRLKDAVQAAPPTPATAPREPKTGKKRARSPSKPKTKKAKAKTNTSAEQSDAAPKKKQKKLSAAGKVAFGVSLDNLK
eukprot:TRINITY_DN68039_c3_g11_i1.p2 TRINITY_DN68039_c3_g11~~TRINITY_DN68039_c3_g11_i1.p2  ORF type:complete len:145 (+),score=19.28 TRINITY_DN68039_c3_g11_i1:62-436(+)